MRSWKIWNKWNNYPQDIKISDGISIDKSFYDIKESRVLTMLLKGVVVYLLTMGGIGSYLTAVGSDFSAIAVNLTIFITALICGLLYYNGITENGLYLVFFALFTLFIYVFRDFINSGFYSIVNDTLETAAEFFDMSGFRQYNEKIADTRAAVTIFAITIGVFSNIVLNNYISRTMRYITSAVIILILNLIPIYFEQEPSPVYSFMMLAGLVMSYVLRAGKHSRLHRSESVYKLHERKKKRSIDYGIDSRSFGESMVYGAVIALVLVMALNAAFPRNEFDSQGKNTRMKDKTVDVVYNVLTLGVAGLFNYYETTAGINSGRLGGVSSIRLDYQTDIMVKFTPYTTDRIYFKNFSGKTYLPYRNMWEQSQDYTSARAHNYDDARVLKKYYAEGGTHSASATAVVTNVDTANVPFLPYYTTASAEAVYTGEKKQYKFYPYLSGNESVASKSSLSRKETQEYTYIPTENYDVIKEFVEKAGIKKGTPQEIADQLQAYYQKNMPYTTNPGATKRGNDFVNYFLTTNRKGYCVHFASAAALIFRYFGIPSRYCEGYVIDYDDIMIDGNLDRKSDYDQYYSGYNPLGRTAVMNVPVTDANAHAWVEMYVNNRWIVADVTPYAGDDDRNATNTNFWASFRKGLRDRANSNGGNRGGSGFKIDRNLVNAIEYTAAGIVILFILIVFAGSLVPVVRYRVRYSRSDRSDRLILEYTKKLRRRERQDRDLRHMKNYRSQIEYMCENGMLVLSDEDRRTFFDILQKAGFSRTGINGEEYKKARSIIKEIKKPGRKKKSEKAEEKQNG